MSNGTLASVTDPAFANFMARSPFRWQGDAGGQNWLNDLYNMGTAAPTLASVTPNTIVHGAPDTLITATGTGFINGAQLLAGSTALATNFISGTSLSATLPASSLAAAGTIQISVQNPDGRTSAQVAFTVT
jgi:trimeric autotransporter adhesin